jgi:hypothetical protein
MPTYVTREEFEARIRPLEDEVTGEKAVTRHILEQTHRNGDDLAAVRSELGTLRSELNTVRSELGTVKSRLDHVAGDVALIKADLGRHGRMLDVLVQDMRLIRAAIEERDAPGQSS